MEENGLIDNEFPKSVSAGPGPLPRFNHPEHGELEIYGFDGRSKLCRSVSDSTQEYRIGTRTVNRLLGGSSVRPRPVTVKGPSPDNLAELVSSILGALPDGPVRTRIARDVWAAADAFLST